MNLFKQFAASLYSPKTMAMFRFQKVGKTIGYVFIMMLISYILIGTNLALSITTGVNEFEKALEKDIPSFQLENGKLSSKLKKPIIREDGRQTFIFDTTQSIQRKDLHQYANVIAILHDKAVVKTNGQANTLEYVMLKDIHFTKQDLVQFVNANKYFLPLIIGVVTLFAYIFATFLKFIGITVLATVGLVLKKIMKKTVSFRQLWIISAYAVTIPTLFFALMKALNIVVPAQFLVYWFVAILLLSLVIQKIPYSKSLEGTDRA